MSTNRFEELVAKSMGAKIDTQETPKTEEVKTEAPKEEVKEEVKAEETSVEEVKPETTEETNSSLKEEEVIPQETKDDTPSEEKVVAQPSFNDMLSEKTNGKFKTYEELNAALSEQPVAEKNNFANEQIEKLNEYIDDGTIQISPLAFMRGRTLDNAFVILDEGQNTTNHQMKMFLTRMGQSAKFMITGDLTQIDLQDNKKSGLLNAKKILKDINWHSGS